MKLRELVRMCVKNPTVIIGGVVFLVIMLDVVGCKATCCENQNPSFPTVKRWWR